MPAFMVVALVGYLIVLRSKGQSKNEVAISG